VGLVSQQWDAVDWACVLCDDHIHESPPFQMQFLLWEKPEVAGSQILAVGGTNRPGWCDALPKKKPARQLQNGQTQCRDEADLLTRSLWMQNTMENLTYCTTILTANVNTSENLMSCFGTVREMAFVWEILKFYCLFLSASHSPLLLIPICVYKFTLYSKMDICSYNVSTKHCWYYSH